MNQQEASELTRYYFIYYIDIVLINWTMYNIRRDEIIGSAVLLS